MNINEILSDSMYLINLIFHINTISICFLFYNMIFFPFLYSTRRINVSDNIWGCIYTRSEFS